MPNFRCGHRIKRVAGICGGGGRGGIRASRCGGERRRGGAGEHCECNDGDECFSLYQHRTNRRFDAAAAPTVARGISAGRRKMQPGTKKAAPALTGAATHAIRFADPAPGASPSGDALTNDRRRRCDGIADHRVVDVEAKWTRVGRIVQPQRDRIALNPVQVQPGRLEIQGPGTASAVRFRGRNDSRRNSSRSFIDRVLAEEGPIALLVNGMRDEWVDYVVKRKARSGRTVIVVNAIVKVSPATLAKQGDFDARSDGVILSVVATAVAVAIIGETEIEIGRVGIVAGVNDLDSLLAESDFPRFNQPARAMRP